MTRAEDICLTIADLMSQVSKKLYKLGQVVTKISENLATIEKYCEKNLRDTHCLSDIYNELKKSIFASCNQVRKHESQDFNRRPQGHKPGAGAVSLLVAELAATKSCRQFVLEKDLGETRVQTDDEPPSWAWPAR